LPSESREIVVLVLKNVIYQHTELSSLEEFLVKRYRFERVEEETCEVSGTRLKLPLDQERLPLKEKSGVPSVWEGRQRRYSSVEIYEGDYLDAKIRVYFLGDIIREKDILEISEVERSPLYLVKYQMVKLASESGYALQRLIERLHVDIGLKVGSEEWVFHRSKEG